ncbi:hypothetical protein DPMN_079741 [Dreissena polymorpha]|uniref:Uncharacterized protein n=1 Tax=Dreissena polymorpha TaxID=45954 RepID=A0A9D3YT50_DREPO|nr:hypothetical protein DPMN_079741 [Dreissena polymorpha]
MHGIHSRLLPLIRTCIVSVQEAAVAKRPTVTNCSGVGAAQVDVVPVTSELTRTCGMQFQKV